MLQIKPTTQLIGGIQTPAYGVFFGRDQLDDVPALMYGEAEKIVAETNRALLAARKDYRGYSTASASLVYRLAKDIARAKGET